MTDDDEIEAILEEAKENKRHTSQPENEEENQDDSPEGSQNEIQGPDRTTAIKDALLAIERGDRRTNVTIRDEQIRAFLDGIESSGDLETAVTRLANRLDDDPEENPTRSDIGRLAIRVGLHECLPEMLEDARTAHKEALLEQADEF
ncbi:hypothetical protein [Halocatena salina]|uniref:DUF8115 domain-containing protein n=1 Tax=Halocatena salina TaxID=2934340 RepID=A0A8U0A6M9_9EURY|nr:hypothetical protein [Halocatena salina]UPM44752.1 hypothetical protein MW046_15230 [Halocatena salina]